MVAVNTRIAAYSLSYKHHLTKVSVHPATLLTDILQIMQNFGVSTQGARSVPKSELKGGIKLDKVKV